MVKDAGTDTTSCVFMQRRGRRLDGLQVGEMSPSVAGDAAPNRRLASVAHLGGRGVMCLANEVVFLSDCLHYSPEKEPLIENSITSGPAGWIDAEMWRRHVAAL